MAAFEAAVNAAHAAVRPVDDLETDLKLRALDLCHYFGQSEDASAPGEFKLAGGLGLHVHVADDDKLGFWKQQGGDEAGGRTLLSLIAFREEIGPAEARVWARRWLTENPEPLHALPDAVARAGDAERRDRARLEWHKASEMLSQPARLYLASRGILPARMPATMRCTKQGIMFAARLPGAEWPEAVQIIYLDAEGKKRPVPVAPGSPAMIAKRTLGVLKDRPSVKLAATTAGGEIYHAEGPETGLTLWLATGCETHIWLGGIPAEFSKVAPTAAHVIAADDDVPRPGSTARRMSLDSLRDKLALARAGGVTARLVTPFVQTGRFKVDFNDLAINGTYLHPEDPTWFVRERLQAPAPPPPADAIWPEFELPARDETVTLAQADSLLVASVGRYKSKSQSWLDKQAEAINTGIPHNPVAPAIAIPVQTGLGKTERALDMVRDLLAEGERGTIITTPTYALGQELSQRAAQKGMRIDVLRARTGSDRVMCQMGDAVAFAQEQGLGDVQKSLCGKPGTDRVCKFYETCAYQDQRKKQPDAWITTTARAFRGDSAEIERLGGARRLIADEGVMSEFLGIAPRILTDKFLDSVLDRAPVMSPEHGARVAFLLTKLRKGMSSIGGVKRVALEAQMTRQELTELQQRISKLQLDLGFMPNMTVKDMRQEMDARGIPQHWNTQITTLKLTILELARFLDREGSIESGRVLVTGTGAELFVPPKLLEAFRNAPALLLDATLDPLLTQFIFPNLEITASIKVYNEHVSYRTVATHANGKTALMHSAAKRLNRVMTVLHERKCETLLVAQKGVISALKSDGLPNHVHTAHFNALKGRDQWRNVARIVVVGAVTPTVSSVEKLAGAITGEALRKSDRLPDGKGFPWRPIIYKQSLIEQAFHPHPLCEAIRAQITDAEIVQAIGRGRGARRTAENPLEIVMLGKVSGYWMYTPPPPPGQTGFSDKEGGGLKSKQEKAGQ